MAPDQADSTPAPLPKLRFNCYLLRPNLPSVESALRPPYRPGNKSQMSLLPASVSAPAGVRAYFSSPKQKAPPWARALAPLFPDLAAALNMSNRLVVFLPVENRTFAVCFGYGSSTLEWSAIEANFGLRFAARRIDPGALKEFRSKRVGASNRTQAIQMPLGSDIKDLDVPLDGEFVRRLAGALDTDGIQIAGIDAIAATDAISFRAETDLHTVQRVLGSMLAEVEARAAKDSLQFVDSLEPLKANSAETAQLNNLLARQLLEGLPGFDPRTEVSSEFTELEPYLLELALPDSISTDDVDTVRIFKGQQEAELEDLTLDGLRSALSQIKGRYTANSLNSVKIMAFDSNGDARSEFLPLKNWLIFEAGRGERRYILTLGRWFALDENYTDKLNADLARIEIVTDELNLPPWPADCRKEGKYNDIAFEALDGAALHFDQVDLRPEDGNEVEVCDLFHENGSLVHVKIYSKSQTLSHLFSQGLVSAQLLTGDSTYQQAFHEAVAERDQRFLPLAKQAPQIVTYAIAVRGNRRIPEDLPSFSKVNLRDFAKRLKGSGVKPTLCRIQILAP